MTDYTRTYDRIHLWDLNKLKTGLAKLEDLYYNYDGVVSLKLIFKLKEELKERVEYYEKINKLYGTNAKRTDRSVRKDN